MVFLDGGGAGDGYMSDILRLSRSVRSARMPRVTSRRPDALAAVVDRVRPVRGCHELFAAGQNVFDEACVARRAGDVGHGIGMEIWERPFRRDHTGDPVEDVAPARDDAVPRPILIPSDDEVSSGSSCSRTRSR